MIFPGEVPIEERGDGLRAEQPTRPRALGEQRVPREVVQLAGQPVPRRQREAALLPVDDRGRQQVGEGLLEQELSLVVTQLRPPGQARAQLDDVVIDERRARLEAMGHARDVDLRQDVVGQVGVDVERAQSVDHRRVRGHRQVGRESLGRVVGPESLGQRRRVEARPLVEREVRHELQVAVRLAGVDRLPIAPQPAQPRPRHRPQRGRHGPAERAREASDHVGDVGPHVASVASEDLVARVPRQRDDDVAPGHLAQVPGGDRRRVAERLAVVADHARQQRHHLGIDHQLVVVGVVALRYQPRVGQLRGARVGEPHREGLHRAMRSPRHAGDHDRGVDASR